MNRLFKIYFLFSILKIIANCSKLEWVGDEFEARSLINSSSNSNPQRTLLCESCQLITFALKNYISSELKIYKNSSPPKGLTDIIVSNFLENHVACSNHIWQPLADNSLEFSIEEFIDSCRKNLSLWEAELETFVIGKMNLEKGIEHVCLKTKSCKDRSEIWKENEYPEKRESKAVILKRRSEEFLSSNKNRDGVITTDSGLQYMILKKGDGKSKPTEEDEVEVQYRGKTLGGTEFDSSFNRGEEPAKMRVSQLIPGWIEALKIMSENEELLLFIPPQLAYGDRGAGELIGPNEVIIFKLRLVKINKKTSASNNQSSGATQRSEL